MSLKPLSSVEAPDLINFDRDGIATEIMTRMKAMPGWEDIWVAEQYQDASQFVIQTFSYLFEKIANANNKVVRENFLSDSFSDRAIYSNLNQMRCTTIQNTESSTEFVGRISNGVISKNLPLDKLFKIYTTDTLGNELIFELIPKDDDGEYLYNESVIIETSEFAGNSFRVTGYAGETQISTIELTQYDLEHARMTISFTDIIENSIQVYYKTTLGTMTQLIKSDKFVVSPTITAATQELFPDGVPHYIVRYSSDGSAEITFGSATFGGAFPEDLVGGSIVIYCRTGGGSATNIIADKVNYATTIDRYGDTSFDVTFTNPYAAYGGDDAETPAEAKIYAPLRYGRDGTAILKTDAQNVLYGTIVKHEILTPQYNEELSNNVPLLHAWHYIVPERDFTDWEATEYVTDETLSSYVNRLFIDINSYLSVVGNNDAAITAELVHTFNSGDVDSVYDFVYELNTIKPLSNSLSLTAYDYDGDLVDHINFDGNYPTLGTIVSTLSSDHAVIDSEEFTSLYIQDGVNNIIKVKFDNKNYTFSLTLPSGVSSSIASIVESLQSQMETLIGSVSAAQSYFSAYQYYDFFSVVDSKLRISSPRTGKLSRIELIDHELSEAADEDLYVLLGISEGTYYPASGTEKVFVPIESTYYHGTGEIDINIDSDLIIDQVFDADFDDEWNQTSGDSEGSIFSIAMDDDQPDKLLKVIPGTDVYVKAYNNDTLIDYFTISAVTEADQTSFDEGQGTIFDTDSDESYFDDSLSSFNIKLIDGVAATLYEQSYPVVTHMEVYKNDVLWKTLTEADCTEYLDGYYNSWTQDAFSDTGKFSLLPVDFTDFITYTGIPVGFTTEVTVTRNEAGGDDVVLTGDGTSSLTALLAAYTLANPTYTFTVTGNSTQVMSEPIDGVSQTITLSIPETIPTYELKVYKKVSDVSYLIGDFTFEYSTSWVSTDATDVGVESDDLTINVKPEYTGEKILFSFKDPTEDTTSPTYYENGFADFDRIEITYQKKTYDYITAAYTPNPYNPTGEAKVYMDKLKDSETKLLGLEHIIKDINFAPVGGTLTLTIAQGYSEKDVYDRATAILLDNYGYSNTNANHTIGDLISETLMRSALLKELAGDYGLEDVSFSNGTLYDDLDTELTDAIYFFIADEDMISAIKEVEADEDNLSGLSDMFEMVVEVETRARVY